MIRRLIHLFFLVAFPHHAAVHHPAIPVPHRVVGSVVQPVNLGMVPIPFFVGGHCVTTSVWEYTQLLDEGNKLALAGGAYTTCAEDRGLWPNDPNY